MPISTPTPTSTMPMDAPSSKCSYCWHTLNLVWFSAVPARGRERQGETERDRTGDRMGDSPSDRQSDSQTSWKPARQTWVSLQKELVTWRCKLEPAKGKIKWKTYIVKINYWQAAVSCSGARRRCWKRRSRRRRNRSRNTRRRYSNNENNGQKENWKTPTSKRELPKLVA